MIWLLFSVAGLALVLDGVSMALFFREIKSAKLEIKKARNQTLAIAEVLLNQEIPQLTDSNYDEIVSMCEQANQ